MSSKDESKELKAGHPPAVKAGGMRVARSHRNSSGDKTEMTPEEEEEFGTSPPKADKQSIVISGAQAKGDKDFTVDAVKHYHDKPVPAKEMKHNKPTHNIQQPR